MTSQSHIKINLPVSEAKTGNFSLSLLGRSILENKKDVQGLYCCKFALSINNGQTKSNKCKYNLAIKKEYLFLFSFIISFSLFFFLLFAFFYLSYYSFCTILFLIVFFGFYYSFFIILFLIVFFYLLLFLFHCSFSYCFLVNFNYSFFHYSFLYC